MWEAKSVRPVRVEIDAQTSELQWTMIYALGDLWVDTELTFTFDQNYGEIHHPHRLSAAQFYLSSSRGSHGFKRVLVVAKRTETIKIDIEGG